MFLPKSALKQVPGRGGTNHVFRHFFALGPPRAPQEHPRVPRDRPRVPQDVIFFDFWLFLGGPGPYFLNIFCEFQCVVWCGVVWCWCWWGPGMACSGSPWRHCHGSWTASSAVAVLAVGIWIYMFCIYVIQIVYCF